MIHLTPRNLTLKLKLIIYALLLSYQTLFALELEHGANSEFFDGFYAVKETTTGIIAVGVQGIDEDSSQGFITFMDSEGNKEKEVVVKSDDAKDSILFDFTELNNGDFVAVGWRKTWNRDKEDAWVIRFNSNGDIIWNRAFGDANQREKLYFVSVLSNGQILTGGRTETDSAVRNGLADGVIVLLNEVDGRSTYGQRFGENITRAAFYHGIGLTDGGYALAGWATDDQYKTDDIWVIRVSASNEKMWEKKCGGGNKDDVGYSLIANSNGSLTIFGWGQKSSSEYSSGLLAYISADGNSCEIDLFSVGDEANDRFYFGKQLDDGSLLAVGLGQFLRNDEVMENAWYALIGNDGKLKHQWLLDDNRNTRFYGAAPMGNGELLLAGRVKPTVNQKPDGLLVKLVTQSGENNQRVTPNDESSVPWDREENEETIQYGTVNSIQEHIEFTRKLQVVNHNFVVSKPSWMVASINYLSRDFDLELIGPDGFITASNHTELAAELIEQPLKAGTYTLRVNIPDDYPEYHLSVVLQSISDNIRRLSISNLEADWTDEDKLQVERLLSYIGYDPGKVDGIFGNQTRQAIRAFQTSVDTNPTGSLNLEQRYWLAILGSEQIAQLAKQKADDALEESNQPWALEEKIGDNTLKGNKLGLYKGKQFKYLGEISSSYYKMNGLGIQVDYEKNRELIGLFKNEKLIVGILKTNDGRSVIGEFGNYQEDNNSYWGVHGYTLIYYEETSENYGGYWQSNQIVKEIPISYP